jgi:hypothetical protein
MITWGVNPLGCFRQTWQGGARSQRETCAHLNNRVLHRRFSLSI